MCQEARRKRIAKAIFFLSFFTLLLTGCGNKGGGAPDASKEGGKTVDIYLAPPAGADENLWKASKAEIAERFRILAEEESICIEDLGSSLRVAAGRGLFRGIDPQMAVDHLLAGPSRFGLIRALTRDVLYLSGEDLNGCSLEIAADGQSASLRLSFKKESLSRIRDFRKGYRTLFFCQKGTAKHRSRDLKKKEGPQKIEFDKMQTALCFPLEKSKTSSSELLVVPSQEDPRLGRLLLRALEAPLPALDINAFVRPEVTWQSPGGETGSFLQKREALGSPATEVFYTYENYEIISDQAFDRFLHALKLRLDALGEPYALGKCPEDGFFAVAFGERCPDSITLSLLCQSPLFSVRTGVMATPIEAFQLSFEDAPAFPGLTEDGKLTLSFAKTREYLYALSETAMKHGQPLITCIGFFPFGVSSPSMANGSGLLAVDEPLLSEDVPARLSALVRAAEASPIHSEFILLEVLTETNGALAPIEGFPVNAYEGFTDKLQRSLSAQIPRLLSIDATSALRFTFTVRDDAPTQGFLEDIRAVFDAYDFLQNPFDDWCFRLADENSSCLLEVMYYTVDPGFGDAPTTYDLRYDEKSARLEPFMGDFSRLLHEAFAGILRKNNV